MPTGHTPQTEPTASQVRAAHAKAVGGKRDRCSKGKSCSAACITRTDRCLVEIPLSPAKALGQVRASVEAEKSKQLQLLRATDYVPDREARRRVTDFRRKNEKELVDALSVGDQDRYNLHRQKVVDFNKMLVREGLEGKTGLVNVPVSWERARQVKTAYLRAYNRIESNMADAARLGDRAAYDREERKLMTLQRRLGVKVGDDQIVRRGFVWNDENGDANSRNYFLKGLRESSVLKGSTIVRNPGTGWDGDNGSISISRMVAGHKVSLEIEKDGKSFSFKIDGSYEKPKGLSNEIGMRISRITEEMFSEVVSHMDEGSVVSVYPYNMDGRGPKRRRAYERFGFGSVPGDVTMYGMVEGGRIYPATRDDMDEYESRGEFNFAELSKEDRAKLVFTMLWGIDAPSPGTKR